MRSRLDRYLCARMGISRGQIRPLVAQGRVAIDGRVTRDVGHQIGEFTRISFDGEILQAKKPDYIMMHKPTGVVSATRDEKHPTVIELLGKPNHAKLHIAGRLDFNSTGLLLLTNDGSWSRHVASPQSLVAKRYLVTLEDPLTPEYADAFAAGMYFAYEDLTIRPATLDIISDHVAEVTLREGRYHQIKRMFGRFRNRVVALHRFAIGEVCLDTTLEPGQNRALRRTEITALGPCSAQ